jgi:hypothetical protein
MKVRRKVHSSQFPELPMTASKSGFIYTVIHGAGACDLPVSYSEKEFKMLFEVVEGDNIIKY